MKKRIKKKWIAALRSGKYKQTQYSLRDAQGFCCLGVLCDLHAKETGKRWGPGSRRSYFGEVSVLPDEVELWAGIENATESIYANNESLIDLNDQGISFLDIADKIEANL